MKPLRIVLADDHSLVRAGIRVLLQGMGDVEVVGEASDGHAALQLVEHLQPDVLLTDIAMPGLNGLETLARISRDFPQVRVVILSMHVNGEYVLQALQSGAAGYLLKDAAVTELDLALKTIAGGEVYLSPAVSKHLVADVRRRAGEVPVSGGPFAQLTPRQREVLQLIAEGHTSQQIAHRLGLSIKTVETHRLQLMQRLDIHDIAGLVRYAIREGLIKPDR